MESLGHGKLGYITYPIDSMALLPIENHNLMSCRYDTSLARKTNWAKKKKKTLPRSPSIATTVYRLLVIPHSRLIIVQPLLNFFHLVMPIRGQHEPRPGECTVHQGEGEPEPEAVQS